MANKATFEVVAKFIGATKGQIITEKVKKALMWLDTTENDFPNIMELEVLNDNIEKLKDVQKGDIVKVKFNIRGRKWENPETKKTTIIQGLNAWYISVEKKAPSVATTNSNAAKFERPDDLPF